MTAPERQSQHDWDPHLTPPTCQAPGPPTLTRGKKSANGLTLQNVQKATTACLPMHAGTAAAWGITQAKGAPSSLELKRAHTPLRYSHFEREVVNKSFTSHILTALHNGVDVGYTGPRGPQNAKNLPSASPTYNRQRTSERVCSWPCAGSLYLPTIYEPSLLWCRSGTQKNKISGE